MTFDVMSNSPCVSQGIQGNLEGESTCSSLSEVTKGFFPGTPSIITLTRACIYYYYGYIVCRIPSMQIGTCLDSMQMC